MCDRVTVMKAHQQNTDLGTAQEKAQHVVNSLVNEAVRRGSDDNVSAILLTISDRST